MQKIVIEGMENKMKKRLAIIGSGEMAVIIAENAKKMNIETHSFSNNMNDRVMGYSDCHHNIDIFDINSLVNACRELNVAGVIPTTELTISIAAKVAALLELNGMSVDVAEKVTDKGFVREKIVGNAYIKQPHFVLYERDDEIPKVDKYPVVVKPTAMGGKRGVSVANNQEELKKAIDFAIDNMPNEKRRIIIEGFLKGGKEYSVESLSYHGRHQVIQITEKITSGPPHCVELGHMQPALLSESLKRKIDIAIGELLSIVGIDNTTSHTEIKIIDDEIYLIELNARSGGDHIAYPLTELSTGYPYIQGAIEIAINDHKVPELDKYTKRNCGVLFVVKQTAFLKQLFDKCEDYSWLYKKNFITEELQEIVHNEAFDTNYMMYLTEEGIPKEIEDSLKLF